MNFQSRLIATAAVALWPFIAHAANITPVDAAKHVGETATVCGTVASATYAEQSRGEPTFLNLDRAYPNQIFTAVIWGENRAAFGAPETTLLGKHICTTGMIQMFRGRPEIILHSKNQLTQ